MRCDEVVRELAAPTDNRDRGAIAEHLSACSACAEWARRAECLDRLWETTRPDEPSPEAWDAVWAQIAPTLPGRAAAPHEDETAAGVTPSRNGSGPRIFAHPAPAPALALAPAPAGPRSRGRSWRAVAAVALVGLAQAAAILVALGLAWRPPSRPDPRPHGGNDFAQNPSPAPAPIRVATPLRVETDIPTSSWIMIVAEGSAARMVDRTPTEQMNTGSDLGLVIFNVMEGIATPQVAAR